LLFQIAKATHNIFAFRFIDKVTNAVYHDCDDDGETAAGARLAEVLRLMPADGVAVIVSRYFGGVKLGLVYMEEWVHPSGFLTTVVGNILPH
jgi:putative IMPACT (imprinted ancient) family translation regulator